MTTRSANEDQVPALDTMARPLRDLRISVTDRCNFRCPYCMPAELYGERHEFLPKPQILAFEEIERLARLFVEGGATKIRLTGGEPLLRAELASLVALLARIDGVADLTLTTNGVRLPEQAQELAAAGLRRVTVSLDSLDDAVFATMSGGKGRPETVLEGIEAAERAGLLPIKINCVVQRGVNDHTIVDLARFFRGSGRIVRFIEYMDVGTLNHWDSADVVSAREIVDRIDAVFPLRAAGPNYRGEVARRYVYEDGAGEIGIIASVTQPFCGDCTRARLTTDGHFVTCLFASQGTDLQTPLRAGASDDDLRALLRTTWRGRRDRYSEERAEITDRRDKLQMYRLGG
ncbi:MAG: GTP 3',8-cyclase MoaA [Deltaproteobacteria bacterium]|nr:GTP 3',8-cyclase MoaA [Deltaproteobacteria bacterium]